LQANATLSLEFIAELKEYGIDGVRLRADCITQTDFKNVLIVWFFQYIVCYYVVFSTTLTLADIYENQLSREFGITRLITMIVMHI